MRARIDRLLGHVTMYRLVVYVLGGIALVAVVEAAVGVLPATWWVLLVRLAIILAVAHGANAAIAALARTHPHHLSTTITGLLVFFILPTGGDAGALLAAAVTALVAVASKYAIAVRGRHLFNPAALGVFVVSLFGVSFGAWWVGTPVLLPAVVLGGLLVLLRLQRLTLGLVYVVLASAILLVRYLLAPLGWLDAVNFAIASSPSVFLASFMLSEPLTLPPRRWQRLLVAVVVAVVATIPFSTGSIPFGALDLGPFQYPALRLGPLHSTPEFALLVGNLLGFLFGQRRGIRLEYLGRTQLSPTSAEFTFRPLSPLRFRAGQFIELSLPHARGDSRGSRRMFSIVSAPGDGTLSVGVRLGSSDSGGTVSTYKRAMLALEPGARITATSIGGDFTLPSDPAVKLLLVAGGIGVTPFVAQLRSLAGQSRDAVVVYAASSADELGYLATLLDAASHVTGARVIAASRERPVDERAEWAGPERLTADVFARLVPDAASRRAAVSGSADFIGGMRVALRGVGVRQVRTDVFFGY